MLHRHASFQTVIKTPQEIPYIIMKFKQLLIYMYEGQSKNTKTFAIDMLLNVISILNLVSNNLKYKKFKICIMLTINHIMLKVLSP